MSTRIRYKKDNGWLISSRTFTVNGTDVLVKLNTNDNKFVVMDASTENVLTEGGTTNNLSVLKIQAKKALSKLGVEFETETRDRGTNNETQATTENNG